MKKIITLCLLMGIIIQPIIWGNDIINGNTITMENKKIVLNKNGEQLIYVDNQVIAKIYPFNVVSNATTGKSDWITSTAELCKLSNDGNTFSWELWKKTSEETFKNAEQSLTILEDGRISVTTTFYNPTNPDLKPRYPKGPIFVVLPFCIADNSEVSYNGETKKLTSDASQPIVRDFRSTENEFILYKANPNLTFSISLENIVCSIALINNDYRMTFIPKKVNTVNFILNLNPNK